MAIDVYVWILSVLTGTSLLSASISEPVRVDGGLISGTSGASQGVRVFKGVPFAAQPVWGLRWRPPGQVAAWNGVRQAVRFSPGCAGDGGFPVGDAAASEDCLYLNVWTAATSAAERRAVMVWIADGGDQPDSRRAAEVGDALAEKGVVVVTIDYRRGVFGFLAHPLLSQESGRGTSGDYGIMDQIAALQWVQRNIGAFGGDRGKVTVFGGRAVVILTASPLAKGLFQRAICQSGSVFGEDAPQKLSAAEWAGSQFGDKLGATSLSALRSRAATELLRIGQKFLVTIDECVLPAPVPGIYSGGQQSDVPLLMGSNVNEGTPEDVEPTGAASWVAAVRRRFGNRAPEYLKTYPANSNGQAAESRCRDLRDIQAWSARTLLRLHEKNGKSNGYMYYFLRSPWMPKGGACAGENSRPRSLPANCAAFHGAEIPYVFDNLGALTCPWKTVDRTLADIMSSYWVNFAKTGDPNGAGLPKWPVYHASDEQVMQFGDKAGAAPMPLKYALDALDRYLRTTGSM